ncbi:unnamed protein product [Mytilus coruscus]|uniref:Integrase SAM-like N-terminal domain-containing protein n=1 Tax=Mytilus coruscus TaxID=42192 RepID=A0A6J8A3E2_MYTCO|nr:unnamed protein product [Mytilus coruscus]
MSTISVRVMSVLRLIVYCSLIGNFQFLEPFKDEVNKLLQHSVSSNTMNLYENAIYSFSKFQTSYHIEESWPPPINHIINYVAYLSKNGYSYTTAKTYLSGINHKLKINNWNDYSKSFILEKNVERYAAFGKRVDSRKPINVDVLKRLISILHYVCKSLHEANMFRAAFSLAFFGFMRIGEITRVNKNADNHVVKISDIKFDINSEISVTIMSSKTDQTGCSTTLILSSNDNDDEICVVKTLKDYLHLSPDCQGQLFCHLNQNKLTRFQFLAVLRSALNFLSLKPEEFNTHSFQIGVATTAALEGKTMKKYNPWGDGILILLNYK